MKRTLIGPLLCLALAAGAFNPHADAKAIVPGFDFEAHRGGRDARPENTLYAFAYAMEVGVQSLELDMQLTADGEIVISHNPFMNPDLARGPDGAYVKAGQFDLRTMTLAEIRRFDVGRINPASDYYKLHGQTQLARDGVHMPTLGEVFELVRAYGNTTITFNIETKSYPDPNDPAHRHSPDPAVFVQAFYKIVKKYGMEHRVFLQSFDWRTLLAMHALDPDITLVALEAEQPAWGPDGCYLRLSETAPSPWLGGLNIHDYNGNYVRAAQAVHADIVSPYWEELTPELLREAHALGLKVVPWTVDEPKDMVALLDMGVDGLITDRPWLLRPLLEARGLAVPAPTVNERSPFHTGTAIKAVAVKKATGGSDAAQ